MSRRADRGNRHLKNRPRHQPKPIAVIDTNVFLDIHSCYDLRTKVDELHKVHGNDAVKHPDVTYRIARAKEATLLAFYLAETNTHTFSLRGEAIDMLQKFAPPAPGGESMESDFVMTFAHFVGDYVLKGWRSQVSARDEHVRKDAADRWLVGYAKRKGIPVITHEGYTQHGIVDDNTKKNMRGRCQEAGVAVFAPREFYAGKLDPEVASERFLDRFYRKAPQYLAGRTDKMEDVLRWVFGYYRMILRGEVEGTDARVPTSLF
jgi:hypothetical protein